MTFVDHLDIRTILILRKDRFSARMIVDLAREVFPAAACRIVERMADVSAAMARETVDLWLTGLEAADGDLIDFLAEKLAPREALRRVLIVTAQREYHLLLSLRRLPIGGVFDLREEEPAQLKEAIRSVAAGQRYWSPSLLERLREHFATALPVSRLLTPLELMVLSVLGAGIDDESAAERLEMKASSVHSVRRQLHHKLSLRHRGDLMRFAVEHGFVRFTEKGIIHPGLALLREACQPRARGKKRPGA